jgi:hypothetical protein
MASNERAPEPGRAKESTEKNAEGSQVTAHPGKRTIQVLIFAAGLLIGPLLALGSIPSVKGKIGGGGSVQHKQTQG